MAKILIVDDEQDLLYVVKILLTKEGFEVITHSTYSNVEEIVLRHSPDLILLDGVIHGGSGREICKELKKNYPIPVVLFSAHSPISKTYKDYDADGFIQKPFDIPDFINTIKSYLN